MLYRGVFALVLLTLLALVTACGAGVAHAQSETVPGSSGGRDREALVALYNATDGPNWADNTNWLSEGPIGEWYGVTADGRVSHLDLNHNNLSGPIPAELGNLSNLRELVLWQNQLSGPIPPALQNLTQLAHLDLDVNRLSGTIPPWLGDLEALTELHLRHNQFEGSIPPELGKLPSLTLLSLDDNLLTGQIPSELGNLSSLTDLRLYNNRLTGPIPSWLGNLSHLEYLYLGGNKFTGPIPTELQNLSKLKGLGLWEIQLSGTVPSWIGEFTELERLYLSRNQLEGPIPVWLSNLSNLTHLNLAGNQLTGPIPTQLGNLSNLTVLALYGNQLTGSIPPGLGNLSKLTHLQLYRNQLTGPIPSQLGSLSALKELILHRNQFTGSIPAELGDLTSLDALFLDGNQLTGPIPASLGDLAKLRRLSLYGNQLTGSIPPGLGNLSKLTRLQLYRNQLTGPIPSQLGSLSALKELNLHRNQFTGSIPAELGDLTSLDALFLDSNQLTGPIPASLGDLAKLRRLSLHHNLLTGAIPPGLGNLSKLTHLQLYRNQLTGPIPSQLGSLSALKELNLHRNQFTGSIPAELGDLTSLDALFLDGNQLTGPIPASLGDLAKLRRLSLHHNLLTGAIPESLTNLADLERIEVAWNAFTGCVPVALRDVPTNDLGGLGLPYCGVTPSASFSTGELEALFDEIVNKTEQREAFSEIKESNVGFSPLDDMNALRSEFVASRTETDLYYALMKLSNARRDRHLRVEPVDGGLQRPERASCISAPVHILPDLTHIKNPTFFVAWVGEGRTTPKVGDTVVGVNGRSMAEYVNEFTPWIRHSSLHTLYWQMAYELPQMVSTVPPKLYSEQLNLTLENPWGQRYEVSLPYTHQCRSFDLMVRYPGFCEVLRRESFNAMLDRSRQIILLQWYGFRSSLVQDIVDLMEYAEREQILDYDMIIDVTSSGGGSGGAYAIQRLVDQPFRTTFGNVRLSDLGKDLVEHYAEQEPDADAPDVFGLNLSRSWLIDWARTDAMEAIRRGDAYTPPVPFKLAHLPKDSHGILPPAPMHFSGNVAIINARTSGGSHLDQFMAMLVDNDLATFIGVPTGGYSNTWEGHEVLRFQDADRPLVNFMWSIGHTIRPNGEVLEGNPAQPDIYILITRDNFRDYHRMLFDDAIAALDPMRASTDGSCIVWKIGDEVNPTAETEARETVLAVHDYAVDLGLSRLGSPITIFVYRNLDTLGAEFEATAGRILDDSVGPDFAAGRNPFANGSNWVAVNTSADRYREWTAETRERQLGGHFSDALLREMSGLPLWAQRDQVPPGGPAWLLEGSRKFLTYQALRPSGPESCDPTRGRYAHISESVDTPLSETETSEDFWALENPSAHGFLAVELLAEQAGPEAVISYYASLRPGTIWQEAFQAAFGMTVEESYQLFEERRSAGFPRPRCETLPPLVTIPGSPEYVKWYIGPDVPPEYVGEILEGTRLMHEYAASRVPLEPGYEIQIFLYGDLDTAASITSMLNGWPIQKAREYWENGFAMTGPHRGANGSSIMTNTFSERYAQTKPKYRMKVAAHELLHAYQTALGGLRHSSSDDQVPTAGPRWLREGIAEFFAYKALDAGGVLSYETERNSTSNHQGFVAQAEGVDRPLSEMEKKDGLHRVPYPFLLLAAELLASRSGEDALIRFFSLGQPGTTWQEGFETAFGMPVKEFYELFEEHRAAGFPEVELPK